MKIISQCIVCGSDQYSPFLTCKDYTVSKENFTIVKCNDCGFKFTNPRPDDSVLGDYYKAEEYISHTNTRKGLVNKLYHLVRTRTLKKKLDLVRSYVSRGTILDYGCGTGMFLNVCKNAGWESYGMEPDDEARKIASEVNLNLFSDKARINTYITDKKFNVITLWHVLEHVTDMDETLSFFKKRLDKNGVLIIAVPNHVSFDARHYGEHWAAYDVPRHLHHFEKKTIKQLVEKKGFRLRETLPMKFDSYYVSLLSEKYKTQRTNLLKAFLVGFRSNITAGNDKYSSSIYVFSHE